jgi:hypothetical protein
VGLTRMPILCQRRQFDRIGRDSYEKKFRLIMSFLHLLRCAELVCRLTFGFFWGIFRLLLSVIVSRSDLGMGLKVGP